MLVTATVLPIFDYCSIVLRDSSKMLDNKLQRLMNNAFRFIYNIKPDEHITPYWRSLNWLHIKSRRLYYLACYFPKLLDSG